MKLEASATHKTTPRQQIINDLIDDRLKISKAKVYGLEVTDAEVHSAFEGIATRQHITVQQFSQVLERTGISPNTVKARIRAELTWQQMIRGKFGSSLQIGERYRQPEGSAKRPQHRLLHIYPVTSWLRGSSEATISAKRSIADNLRVRFVSCNEGLAMARALRDVAVREPITRSSADLSAQLREILEKIEVGHLTAPEVTAQGLQMFAVCSKKETTAESPLKREVREQLYTKRFESESKKFLEEIRKSAMIEYKKQK
jgi:peptidyl-prolyl cis-trans isomerase SurA